VDIVTQNLRFCAAKKSCFFFDMACLDVLIMLALDQLRDTGDGFFLHDTSNGTPVCGDERDQEGNNRKKT
jgi:hypothetical protein